MNGPTPPVFMVDLPMGSRLIAEGFPSRGVVLSYGGSPFKDFFSNSHYILESLISESELVIVDDPDWLKYPEIGPFLKQQCDEENCYTVVKCAKYGIWAIALAAGKKPRAQAAKMAMALALASYSPNAEQVKASYREYANLCRAIGDQVQASFPPIVDHAQASYGAGGEHIQASFPPNAHVQASYGGGGGYGQASFPPSAHVQASYGGGGDEYGYGGKGEKGMKGMMGGGGGYRFSPYEMYGGKGGKGMY